MPTTDIYNYRKVNDHLITGGQPEAEHLQAAAAEGFTVVINLAPRPGQNLADEAGLVQSLGMAYHHLPVIWDNPQPADFAAFEQVLQSLPANTKTLIHCAANFRVSAFYSLYALKHLGWSQAQAADFRAAIWAGSNYPIWEDFIRTLQSSILAAPKKNA